MVFSLDRKNIYAVTIAVCTVVIIIISSLYLPAFFRERGDFYTSFEYSQMYLNDDRYSELLIEYNYIMGYPPSSTARESLISTIYELCEKDEVKDIVGEGIPFRLGRTKYSSEHIELLFEEYSSYERRGTLMVLNVLYLDGEWEQKSNVLGLSFGGEYIVVFKETMYVLTQNSQNLEVEDVETSVLIHEFGHILGLVGIGYESEHEDEDYEHHCDESAGRCVMSASVQIRIGAYTEPPPSEFCQLCSDDIERIRSMEDDWGPEEYLTLMVIGGQGVIGVVWVAVCLSKNGKEDYELYQQYYDDSEKKVY